MLCLVCWSIFTPTTRHRRIFCGERCRQIDYRIRRGNRLKRLNRKFREP
jgi:hypothetical protein